MDPQSIITLGSGAISALFGALMLVMRQRAEDWRGLYQEERADRKDALRVAADDIRENTRTVKEAVDKLTDALQALPKRADDWSPPARRTDRGRS